MNFTTKKWFW